MPMRGNVWVSKDRKTCCIDCAANFREREEIKNDLIRKLQHAELERVSAQAAALEEFDDAMSLVGREAEIDLFYTEHVLESVRQYFEERDVIRRRYHRELT
jgi:hypothetical protein